MFPKITPITRNIVAINVILYLVSNFFHYPLLYNILSAYFPLSPNFHWWQIISHMFMHAPLSSGGIGITHILFNMFTLLSFGPVLEQTLGQKKYIWLYFLSGIGAFLLFNIWNAYEVYQLSESVRDSGISVSEVFRKSAMNYKDDMTIFENPYALRLHQMLNEQMIGASGAIFGVLAAFATLFPDAKLVFLFIPFPIKAKILMPIIIVASIFLGLGGNVGGIAHFAHVGGALVGFLMARYWKRNRFRIQ